VWSRTGGGEGTHTHTHTWRQTVNQSTKLTKSTKIFPRQVQRGQDMWLKGRKKRQRRGCLVFIYLFFFLQCLQSGGRQLATGRPQVSQPCNTRLKERARSRERERERHADDSCIFSCSTVGPVYWMATCLYVCVCVCVCMCLYSHIMPWSIK